MSLARSVGGAVASVALTALCLCFAAAAVAQEEAVAPTDPSDPVAGEGQGVQPEQPKPTETLAPAAAPVPDGTVVPTPTPMPTPAPAEPEPTPADGVLPPAPVLAEAPPAAVPCEPTCGEGHTCQAGRCVSSCYPPCGPRQSCQGGACVAPSTGPNWDWDAAAADDPEHPDKRLPDGPHRGMLVRASLALGAGSANYAATEDARRTFKGTGVQLALDVGTSIVPGWVLFGRLGLYGLSRELDAPALQPGQGPDEVGDGPSNVGISGGLLGVGGSYFLMLKRRMGMHFTAALGLGGGQVQDINVLGYLDVDHRIEAAPILQLDAGMDFWVSDGWAFGVGARLSAAGGRVVHIEEGEGDADAEELRMGTARQLFIGILGDATYF